MHFENKTLGISRAKLHYSIPTLRIVSGPSNWVRILVPAFPRQMSLVIFAALCSNFFGKKISTFQMFH